jgi:hypothetical protein
VDGTDAAEELSRQILSERVRDVNGYLEAVIVGPLAARLAPTLWRSSYGARIVGGVLLCLAAISTISVAFGWNVAGIAAAVIAICFNVVRKVMGGSERRDFEQWLEPAMWLLLAAAILIAARNDMGYANDGLFAGFIMIGLTFLAQKLTLSVRAAGLLKSPLLVGVVVLIITPFSGFTQAIQWIAAGQVAAMIAAKMTWRPGQKKPKQA